MNRIVTTAITAITFAPAWSLAGLPEALAAAQQRQQTLNRIVVEYEIREVIEPGEAGPGIPGPKGPPPPAPSKRVELLYKNRLLMDGRRLRCEHNEPLFEGMTGELAAHSYISGTDGESARTYFRSSHTGAAAVGQGIIPVEPEIMECKLPAQRPIALWSRPNDSNIAQWAYAEFKPQNSSLPIRGISCEEYRVTRSPSNYDQVWLDPDNHYVAKRICMVRNGRVTEQTDISYHSYSAGEPAIDSWTHTRFSNTGGIRRDLKGKVIHIEVAPELTAADLAVEFPPGARVHDARTQKVFMAQSDGSLREIDLDAHRSGAGRPVVSSLPRSIWIVGALTFALGLIFWVVRRNRLRRT